MFEVQLINESRVKMPRSWLEKLVQTVVLEPEIRAYLKKNSVNSLTIVFLSTTRAKKMNLEFRGRNYATDVLSFSPSEGNSLGELILCPEVLKKQAAEHGLSFKEECSYMVIHGMLHLIGLDHEKSEREAKKMFRIQDRIFEYLFD